LWVSGFSLSSGSAFFELVDFQPQLTLLKLPDIDGYTYLNKFNTQQSGSTSLVIIVSAFAFKADKQRALSLG